MPSAQKTGLSDLPNIVSFSDGPRSPLTTARMLIKLHRLLRTKQNNIVFFHSTFTLAALVLFRAAYCLRARPKAIYCPHGWAISRYEGGGFKARLVRAIEGRACALADVVLNVSHADKALAQRLGYRGRQIVIENAVGAPAADAKNDIFADEPDALHLLFVGRLDRQKGLDVLLEAYAMARRERPDLRLHIVGAKVRDDGGEIPLPEGATLAGWVAPERLDDWYASADAVVVPSRWEGFGLVVAEALRNGTPALVSTRGALPTLIDEGKTGHAFDLDAGILAHRLATLDRATLRAMRPAARASYSARFHLARLHGEIAALYRELTT